MKRNEKYKHQIVLYVRNFNIELINSTSLIKEIFQLQIKERGKMKEKQKQRNKKKKNVSREKQKKTSSTTTTAAAVQQHMK